MKRCAIMQPTYLPWSGYFNLINEVDVFVFLDNVQFDRRSWQSRNRILSSGREVMLSVPIQKCPRATKIKDVFQSDHTDWRHQHLSLMEIAYSQSSSWAELSSVIKHSFYDKKLRRLATMNMELTRALHRRLKLKETEFLVASQLGCSGVRSELLANICKNIECDIYLSPIGSREYLEQDNFERLSGVQLEFQQFSPTSYCQAGAAEFVSHLSIIDVIASLGFEGASAYVGGDI